MARLSLAAVVDGQILLGSFVARLPSLYHQQHQQRQQTSLLSYLASHKKPLRLIVGTGAGVGAGGLGAPSFASLEALFLPQCNNTTEGVAASIALGRPPALTQTQMQENEVRKLRTRGSDICDMHVCVSVCV